MRKFILSFLALICFSLTWAIVEKKEVMTVVKTDGTKVEYTVDEIDQVTFEVVDDEYAMLVAPAAGEELKLTSIPAVFRMQPSEEGNPYQFGISTVAAAEPADARQGMYAVQISVSQLKINASDVDLSAGSASGVTVTLFKYDAEGNVVNVLVAQNGGKLTTAVDTKTKDVTIALNATYIDGTEITVDYKGKVIDVENLDGLNPPFVYVNQGRRFDADGIPGAVFDVENLTINDAYKLQGETLTKFELQLSNGFECYIAVKPEYIGQKVDFATAPEKSFRVTYNDVQLASKGFEYIPQAVDGSFTIVKNEDGSYTIDLDFYNRYIDIYGNARTASKERIVLNYTSDVIDPEPTPVPVENLVNQSQYFDKEGNPQFPLDIIELRHEENIGIPYNKDIKGDKFDFYYEDPSLPTCYFIIKPEFIGKTLDIATAPAQSFYFKYGATEIAASDFSWLSEKVGAEGTITVKRHMDGTFTIDFNVTFKTNGNPETQEHLALNYTSLTGSPVEVILDNNQGQHFMPDGDPESIFDITGATITSDAKVCGVEGYKKFDLTLSNEKECYVAVKPEFIGQEIDFATAAKDAFIVKYDSHLNYGTKNNSAYIPAGINGKLKVVKNDNGSYTIDLDFLAHNINSGMTNNTSKERVVINYTTPEPEPEPAPEAKNEGQHFTADGEAEKVFEVTGATLTSNARINGVAGYEKFTLTLSNGKECYVAVKPEFFGQEINFETAAKDAFIVKYDSHLNYGTKDNSAWIPAGIKGKLKVVKNDNGSYTIDLDFLAHNINSGITNNTSNERVVLHYTGAAE